jgi:triosephosphate isomerase
MNRPIIAANWKMHMTAEAGARYAETLLPLVAGIDSVEIVLTPPATALDRVGRALANGPVLMGAQDVSPEDEGPFTGDLAAGMLAELGCRYGIVGHSERRILHGESSQLVARKAAALLRCGLRPIVCVGEILEERENDRTEEIVSQQLATSLEEVPEPRVADVVVAYEPVWAIGTGLTATPAQAQAVHALIRKRLEARFGASGREVRLQYGGSVNPDNVAALMAEPDIDGALVGGASLDPESFADIVRQSAAAGTDPTKTRPIETGRTNE